MTDGLPADPAVLVVNELRLARISFHAPLRDDGIAAPSDTVSAVQVRESVAILVAIGTAVEFDASMYTVVAAVAPALEAVRIAWKTRLPKC